MQKQSPTETSSRQEGGWNMEGGAEAVKEAVAGKRNTDADIYAELNEGDRAGVSMAALAMADELSKPIDGFRALWSAVIGEAEATLRLKHRSTADFIEAKQWVTSDPDFEAVCELAGVRCVGRLRAKLLQIARAPKAPPRVPAEKRRRITVRRVDTGEVFASSRIAARSIGVHPMWVLQSVRLGRPVSGIVFERAEVING